MTENHHHRRHNSLVAKYGSILVPGLVQVPEEKEAVVRGAAVGLVSERRAWETTVGQPCGAGEGLGGIENGLLQPFLKQHRRDFSRESGFETDYVSLRRSCSVSTFSSDDLDLTTWETKEAELFRYLETHTARVEMELRKIKVAGGGEGGREQDMSDDGDEGGVGIDVSSTILSVNVDEDDFTAITIQSDFVSAEDERKQCKSAFGMLCNLKHEILRLKEYLGSGCGQLRYLISETEDPEDTERLLKCVSAKEEQFDGRLDEDLNRVYREMDVIRNKNDIIIDGVRLKRRRKRFENPIMKIIRKSPISCETWFHGLLFLTLLTLICYMYLWSRASDEWTVYLRLIRSPLLILLLLYLYGINMKVWAMFKIDYVSIFDHPSDATPTPRYVFKCASVLTVMMALLGVGVIVASSFSSKLPIKIIPMVMWLLLIVFLLNPFNLFLRKARYNFIFTVVRILFSPFFFVYFSDFFLADQFNSSVTIFLDIQYLVCYVFKHPWTGDVNTATCTSSKNWVRPVITALPAVWRLLQCLRCFYETRKAKHLINACKYFTTLPVVVFAALFSIKVQGNIEKNFIFHEAGWILICWLLSSFVHGLYTFLWDVCCDWGLWNLRCAFFQRKLVYTRKAVYVVAIVADFVLRGFWTLKLTLAIDWEKDTDLIFTGMCP